MAPLAMGASAMIQGSKGAVELLGRILLHLNQKIIFKLKKEKSPEFPKCLHHILPLSDPIFMLLHSLGQRLKKDTAGLGKGVAEEDSVAEGSCVTSSPTPFPPSRQFSPLPVFAMAVKVFSFCPTSSHAFTLGSYFGPGVQAPGAGLRRVVG